MLLEGKNKDGKNGKSSNKLKIQLQLLNLNQYVNLIQIFAIDTSLSYFQKKVNAGEDTIVRGPVCLMSLNAINHLKMLGQRDAQPWQLSSDNLVFEKKQ